MWGTQAALQPHALHSPPKHMALTGKCCCSGFYKGTQTSLGRHHSNSTRGIAQGSMHMFEEPLCILQH